VTDEKNGVPYPALFTPIKLAKWTLPNRVVMGAIHTGLERRDRPLERIAAFYRERIAGEVGLIITGGVAPSPEGRLDAQSPVLAAGLDEEWHKAIIATTHSSPTRMCVQLLHAGRYAALPECVSASPLKARINRHTPRALSTQEVWQTIEQFADASVQAQALGYHGVEIMGSEGYLINQFTAPVTNQRIDAFGGSLDNRLRFPLEIVKAVRHRVGPEFILIYRISAVDLFEGGMTGQEVQELARRIEAAGADVINTGIGWHESAVPTVAHVVPRAAFSYAIGEIQKAVSIPIIASNRINDPGVANDLIASGIAGMVSMARPFLADPAFVRKARLGQAQRINTCIACNQACLDRSFKHENVSCLVNPRAAHEIEYGDAPARVPKRIAVVGAGAAGMNFAFSAAARGHQVTLFEASNQLGGQLLMASIIPEKGEFREMLRYFAGRLAEEKVDVRLHTAPTARQLVSGDFDVVVIATGVRPREISISGNNHPKVLTYVDVLLHGRPVGQNVAIIGAGGIAFDVAEFLLGEPCADSTVAQFAAEYGVDLAMESVGGVIAREEPQRPWRHLTMMQRKAGRPAGNRQAITTNWIKRDKLHRSEVDMLGDVAYQRIDDEGIHITVNGKPRLIAADTIVSCAGQYSERTLYDDVRMIDPAIPVHIIGGAYEALELDAMRAIEQATRLAFAL
jgi:2,4-dienoyl-CoA reductase (NADPH2)